MSHGQTTDLRLAIARGPECPACHERGFDDWWHEPGLRSYGGVIAGKLKCHGCGKFFSVRHYGDGETHCSMRCAA